MFSIEHKHKENKMLAAKFNGVSAKKKALYCKNQVPKPFEVNRTRRLKTWDFECSRSTCEVIVKATEKALGLEKVIIVEKKSIDDKNDNGNRVVVRIKHDEFAKLDSIKTAKTLIQKEIRLNFPNLKLEKLKRQSKKESPKLLERPVCYADHEEAAKMSDLVYLKVCEIQSSKPKRGQLNYPNEVPSKFKKIVDEDPRSAYKHIYRNANNQKWFGEVKKSQKTNFNIRGDYCATQKEALLDYETKRMQHQLKLMNVEHLKELKQAGESKENLKTQVEILLEYVQTYTSRENKDVIASVLTSGQYVVNKSVEYTQKRGKRKRSDDDETELRKIKKAKANHASVKKKIFIIHLDYKKGTGKRKWLDEQEPSKREAAQRKWLDGQERSKREAAQTQAHKRQRKTLKERSINS